jgi:hypothetical protein
MATIGPIALTLVDWAKRIDDDGKIAEIINLLSQTNEILDDMLWVEGNLPTGHKTTIRTGLPSAYWRLLNMGVPRGKSTTAQITESCGMLETYSDIDVDLVALAGNDRAFRLSEELAFLEGMNQQMAGINMDSVYFVVTRSIPGINGGQPVKYIERMDGRNFLTNGAADVTKAWFVDCGLQYSGSPQTIISGLDHLNGATVSILADGSVAPQQVVSGGSITLQSPASKVTVGLPYVSQLQTLCMEPEGMIMQVQDYRKKISAVAVRVTDTRGLKVGPNFNDLVEIKMRTPAVPMGTAIPLFTGDQRVVIDNNYLVDDDVCIQQDQPLPCTVLGVIPEVSIGDGPG